MHTYSGTIVFSSSNHTMPWALEVSLMKISTLKLAHTMYPPSGGRFKAVIDVKISTTGV